MPYQVNVKLFDFHFPNFLPAERLPREPTDAAMSRISVAQLDDRTAEEYWDHCKKGWLIHVREARRRSAK